MSVADPRLARLKRLVEGLAPQLDLDIAIRLWDGEALPLGRHWSGDLALALRDPVAITRLLRRPRLTTLVELFAEGKLDIEGGTLLDLAARQGGGSSRGLLKRVSKLAAARALLPFFFGHGGQRQGERRGFAVHDTEAWREHYAATTRHWAERLYAHRAAAEAEAGGAKTRLWLLYLASVSVAFQRGTIGIFQTVASRRARGASGLSPTRADLYR